MSKTTIYTCDLCGKEGVDLKLNIVAIGVVQDRYNEFGGKYRFLDDHLYRQAEWCDDCLKATGIILPQVRPKEADTTQYPTLEGMIREWIAQEVQNVNQ